MIEIRRGDDRGPTKTGWLDFRHTFSFGRYYDSQHMGFGPLRVINEDRVVPGAGFKTHGHQDMEIISYVLAGALSHEDSMGTGSAMVPPSKISRSSHSRDVTMRRFSSST